MLKTPDVVLLTQETKLRPSDDLVAYPVAARELADFQLDLELLPEWVGITGGAARAIALKVLFGEEATIRDVDLIGVEECDPDEDLYDEFSSEYMPDDYAYGYGLKTESFEDYFSTRDFTINEVLVLDGQIYLTTQALEDLRTKTIRFSEFSMDDDGNVSRKLYNKAILMACVFEEQFGEGEFDRSRVSPREGSPFFLALALNKAFQYGPEVTVRFLESLDGESDMDVSIEYATELARWLSDETDFEFRGSDIADTINRIDHEIWDGMPPILDDRTEEAIALMESYGRSLPEGVDGY